MTLKVEEVVVDKRLMIGGHGFGQHAVARWKGDHADHAFLHHMYIKPENFILKDVDAFTYGNCLKQRPRTWRRQLIDLQIDDKDPSGTNAVWPVSEDGRSSKGGSKEGPIGDRD